MADHGFLTHAARNRRKTAALLGVYLLAFEIIGAFALILPLLFFDHGSSILSNPLGYAQRYLLPVAVVGGLIFWRLYRGHAKAVARQLRVRFVTRQDEPRFVQVAEEVCTTLGVRFPRFGVIEQPQPNALTVGDGPVHGLIAVTRGMLQVLDDDELAAVIAHEASHIRQGDTRVMAANHALMRTAVVLQTHNPLRVEDWRQLMIPLFFPPALLVLLASSATTRFAMTLARWARRGVKLSRDHVADSEAVRVTHFPEALLTALNKVGGQGAFPGSWCADDLLFDGPADHEGGSHPAVNDRLETVIRFGQTLMNSNRGRRDTRPPIGVQPRQREFRSRIGMSYDAEGRPTERPARSFLIFLAMLRNFFTDRETFDEWQSAEVSWFEWRQSDQRNTLGLTPAMVIPVVAVCAFLLVFHWPTNNDPRALVQVFSPSGIVRVADVFSHNNNVFSHNNNCRDPKCEARGADPSSGTVVTQPLKIQPQKTVSDNNETGPPEISFLFYLFPLIVITAMALQVLRPDLAKKLKDGPQRKRPGSSEALAQPQPIPTRPEIQQAREVNQFDHAMPVSTSGNRTFGRKRA